MSTTLSRKPKQEQKRKPEWPKQVQPGRAIVRVYRRKTPQGNFAYMVANYADGKRRRFDSYASEADALAAADTLARRLDARDYVAASMTQEQAIEYADSVAALKPFNVTVRASSATTAECLKVVGDLASITAAVKLYAERHKQVIKKPVAETVAELLLARRNDGSSGRYLEDLKSRLGRFAEDCHKDACNVGTSDIQVWLDSQKTDKGRPLSRQSRKNYRTVLNTLFQFAVKRGYAADNPVHDVEKPKVRDGDVAIFTPTEIARLLAAASPEFLPSLALGAFAGLRSAEIERLDWEKHIDLAARHIKLDASITKTAARRIVPITDNLAEWLRPYAGRQGKVWQGSSDMFYRAQEATAAATEVKADEAKGIKAQKPVEWKGNALRHSYASYRFAQTADAGRVAGECGNSAAVIHKHYRELVKPEAAQQWFNVRPTEAAANIIPMAATASV